MRGLTLLLVLALAALPALAFGQATHVVTFPGEDYSPFHLEVRPGDTVTWRNDGGQGHDVRSADGLFNSPILSGGALYSFTFTQPGTYNYRCSIHPSMLGTVVVLGAVVQATATPVPAPPTPVPTVAAPATAIPGTAIPVAATPVPTAPPPTPTPTAAAVSPTVPPTPTVTAEVRATTTALAPSPAASPTTGTAAGARRTVRMMGPAR